MNTRELYPEGTNFVHGIMLFGNPMIAVIDTPSETYPEGAECPLHKRQHNSHGWYICLTLDQVYNAYGPVAFENDDGAF